MSAAVVIDLLTVVVTFVYSIREEM